jgi:diguanylate cyclase (GGDEF)-like protein/PAS domain S-box-containing protein
MGEEDGLAADLVHLIDEGPLGDHPGPILLVDIDGEVLARNIPGAPLAHRFLTGELPAVTAMVSAVTAGTGSQSFKISDEDTGRTIDLAAIPVNDRLALLVGRDVSLDHNLRAALVDSRQRYKDLVEISSDFAWETGPTGQFVFVSAAGALGYDPDEMVGRSAETFLVVPEGLAIVSPFDTREPVQGVEVRFRRVDGGVSTLEASAAPLFDDQGRWSGARGVCRDVTEARLRDLALSRARSRERLTTYIVRTIRDEVEPDRMLDAAAEALTRALSADGCSLFRIVPGAGLDLADPHGESVPSRVIDDLREAIVATRDPVLAEIEEGAALAHQLSYHQEMNGTVVLWRSGATAVWDEEEVALLVEVADQLGIALQQVAAHEHLRTLSSVDAMTGLLNRRAFDEAITARLNPSTSTAAGPGTLVYVDLDNFKKVNDTRGHQVGDKALIHLADILKRQSHTGDIGARLGGDEFALWMEGIDTSTAPERAERIIEMGKELLTYSGSPDHPIGLSIGMAVFEPGSGETRENLIARADAVMYEIKRSGKGWYRLAAAPGATVSDRCEA